MAYRALVHSRGIHWGTVLSATLLVASVGGRAEAEPPSADRAASSTAYLAIAMSSARDGWIVGSQDASTFAARWNGSAWTPVRTANLHLGKGYTQQLVAVSSSSSRDAWAVGAADSIKRRKDIVERWNGRRWQLVSCRTPPEATRVDLNAVVDLAPDDVWIVGTTHTAASQSTLALHWDGHRCAAVSTPNPGGDEGNELDGVSASGGRDVWAVGQYWLQGTAHTMAEHWDGRRWTVVRTPTPGHLGGALLTVTSQGRHDAWAAGWCWTHGQSHQQSVTLHWNGRRWRAVDSLNPQEGYFDISGVGSSSQKDVWAVGTRFLHNVATPSAEQWTGHEWRDGDAARVTGDVVEVTGTAVASRRDAWMVGYVGTAQGTDGLIEHWNGRRWRVLSP